MANILIPPGIQPTRTSVPWHPVALWLPLLLGLCLLLSLLWTPDTHSRSPFLQLIDQHCQQPLPLTSAVQEQTPMLFDMVAPGCQSLSFD